MKYLSKEPFSSRPLSEEGREAWERIFGKRLESGDKVKRLCIPEKCIDISCEWCQTVKFQGLGGYPNDGSGD